MSQQLEVTIRLNLENAKKVRAVMKALIPDNINFPRGLSLDMNAEGAVLILSFKSVHMSNSLITTMDEVLEHISVMEKVLE